MIALENFVNTSICSLPKWTKLFRRWASKLAGVFEHSNIFLQIPNLDLAQYQFLLASGPKELHEEAKAKLFDAIKGDSELFLVMVLHASPAVPNRATFEIWHHIMYCCAKSLDFHKMPPCSPL